MPVSGLGSKMYSLPSCIPRYIISSLTTLIWEINILITLRYWTMNHREGPRGETKYTLNRRKRNTI